jgi:hypothetical protein
MDLNKFTRRASLLLVGSLWLLPGLSNADSIAPAGRHLESVLDSMDVEHHWPAGVHVHWENGDPDGRPESAKGKHTHCSAFVAAAAKHLGIYILRPPEHPQILLANAQYEWLEGEGARQGWTPVDGPLAAQAEANRGRLVVATYRNHHDDKPGHIAIVRPSDKDRAAILSVGPQITQAGGTNYRSTDLAVGFAGHPAAWSRHEVRFYSHAVEQ